MHGAVNCACLFADQEYAVQIGSQMIDVGCKLLPYIGIILHPLKHHVVARVILSKNLQHLPVQIRIGRKHLKALNIVANTLDYQCVARALAGGSFSE